MMTTALAGASWLVIANTFAFWSIGMAILIVSVALATSGVIASGKDAIDRRVAKNRNQSEDRGANLQTPKQPNWASSRDAKTTVHVLEYDPRPEVYDHIAYTHMSDEYVGDYRVVQRFDGTLYNVETLIAIDRKTGEMEEGFIPSIDGIHRGCVKYQGIEHIATWFEHVGWVIWPDKSDGETIETAYDVEEDADDETIWLWRLDESYSRSHDYAARRYPSNWNEVRRQVYKRDRWSCSNCRVYGGDLGSAELHVHHIVPLSLGGTNHMSNLVTLCRDCHSKLHPHMRD